MRGERQEGGRAPRGASGGRPEDRPPVRRPDEGSEYRVSEGRPHRLVGKPGSGRRVPGNCHRIRPGPGHAPPERALPRAISRSGRNEGRSPLRERRAGAVPGPPRGAPGGYPKLSLRRDADEDVVGRVEILTLSTDGFRNLANGRVELHPRVNLIVGDNGQGKTNLLEALALVSGRPSFRTHDLAETRQHLAARTVVSVRLGDAGGGPRDGTTLGFGPAGARAKQYEDGRGPPRRTAPPSLRALFLTARDLSRLSGPPAERPRA